MDDRIKLPEPPQPEPKIQAAPSILLPGTIYLMMIGDGKDAYACTSFYSHSKALDFIRRKKEAGATVRYWIDAINVADGHAEKVP